MKRGLAIFVGSGDVLDEMKKLGRDLDLSDHVEFSGYGDDDVIVRVLSTADVCIAPEPSSRLNDMSTMIKVVEYSYKSLRTRRV